MPLVVGHQGSSEGVAPASLEAYAAALAAGADMVEVDVRRTADGRLLARHDPDAGGRPLSALTATEARALVGPVATLDEVASLAAAAGGMLMVDLKDVGGEVEAVDVVLARLAPEQVIVSTMEDASVATLRRARPELEVGLSVGREWRQPYLRSRFSEVFPRRRLHACGATFLSLNRRLLPTGVLSRAARAGIPVYVWTVDGDRELERRLADRRLRGVVTNRPRRALELRDGLSSRGSR